MATCDRNSSVSVFNLTIVDDPAQEHEHHWLWSVIKHPTIQVALTPPGDRVRVNWEALFGFGDLASSIQYDNEPDYSAAIMLANVRNGVKVKIHGNLKEKGDGKVPTRKNLVHKK